MKVTTIDGGFRGRRLGSLTSQTQADEIDSFLSRLEPYQAARSAVLAASSRQNLPQSDAVALVARMTELDGLLAEHQARISSLETSSDLLSWRTEAGRLVSLANAFVQDAENAIVGESTLRPWRVGIALFLGAAVVGVAARTLARIR